MNPKSRIQIRFIAYCLFTGPEQSSDLPGAQSYLGNENQTADIAARIAILKNAVDTAKAQLPESDADAQVVNVFMVPEFYFHGTKGAYIFSNAESDPLPEIFDGLLRTFNSEDYPNWTLVLGSAVTALIANPEKLFASDAVQSRNAVVRTLLMEKNKAYGATYDLLAKTLSSFIVDCQASPNLIVRDRAIIVSTIPLDTVSEALGVRCMSSEKYFISGEDFILCEPKGQKGVITEQMVAYDHIDLSGGDFKRVAFDEFAIFRQNFSGENGACYLDYGVEICLDHDDARLRNNLGFLPPDNPKGSVHVQLIPSYGSAILQSNVVAKKQGFVFNCDGQLRLDGSEGVQQYGGDGAQYTYISYGSTKYGAHSQFARVDTPALGNNPNSNSAQYLSIPDTDILIFDVPRPVLGEGEFEDYYCGGYGAVHIYGLNSPYLVSSSDSGQVSDECAVNTATKA